MKINFTREEMRIMVEIAAMAESVVEESPSAPSAFLDVIDKVFRAAAEMGMPDLIEYSAKTDIYQVRDEAFETMDFPNLLDQYLIARTQDIACTQAAMLDMEKAYTQEQIEAMDENTYNEAFDEYYDQHAEIMCKELAAIDDDNAAPDQEDLVKKIATVFVDDEDEEEAEDPSKS
jgi:hypothetical protein